MSPLDLLGRGWSDLAVQRTIAAWPDRPFIDEESIDKAVVDGRLSLFELEQGIYLFFTDAPSYMARFGVARSEGPIVISRVVLFGKYHADVDAYEGSVLGDLTTGAGFDVWADTLGRAEWTHEVAGVIRKARWLVDGRLVDVSFNSSGECRLVSLMLPYAPEAEAMRAEARQRQLALPGPDRILAALGTPASSEPVKAAFASVDYAQRLPEASSYGEIDFSTTDGFELYVAPAEALIHERANEALPGTLCLSGARYRCDLDFKSLQWQGPLLFGITFDDGPDTVVAKVGRPPDRQHMDEMQGHHRWHFGAYDLHVLYSLAEDHVCRLTLLGRVKDGG
ncbi:hypothetical protein G8A07_01830 [Roseateles sp. DAIF2]|uniref:hypothetical protein n=1 Tax=Roseateles sp. DAIF2 TaxID=2714952 RepID=UPI0018A29F6C|nr:hypothetical protein [Roseateles sp. DAIF2]QPF71793.1 hypothetical protein G8A07_01830 [Roseateles sp. DAIF2]